MIIALIIRGATLDGAIKGIEYYILKINTEKLKNLEVIFKGLVKIRIIFKFIFLRLGLMQQGIF